MKEILLMVNLKDKEYHILKTEINYLKVNLKIIFLMVKENFINNQVNYYVKVNLKMANCMD